MPLFAKKQVTAYPTYGYQDGDAWVVSMRVWVHKRRGLLIDEALVRLFERKIEAKLDEAERAVLKERFADFIADDDYFEQVEFQIEGDSQVYQFEQRTDWNGLVAQEFRLSAKVKELADGEGWLSYTARSDAAEGAGRIRLLERTGVSVVSDIDDTIKVTEVPAGDEVVLRRTFVMDYERAGVRVGEGSAEAVEQMRDKYWQLHEQYADKDICFHYVSGSPWQMFRLLGEFLLRGANAFPEGTFHMKSLRKNLTDPDSWEDLLKLAQGKKATLSQKIEQITEMTMHLPERKLILIGDSGEMDPEVFLSIHRMFPGRVEKIIIRDVLGERLQDDKIEVLRGDTVRYRTRRAIENLIKEKAWKVKLNDKDELIEDASGDA